MNSKFSENIKNQFVRSLDSPRQFSVWPSRPLSCRPLCLSSPWRTRWRLPRRCSTQRLTEKKMEDRKGARAWDFRWRNFYHVQAYLSQILMKRQKLILSVRPWYFRVRKKGWRSAYAKFIVPYWGIKSTITKGCRTSPPANVAWRAGATTLCHNQLYPPSHGLWICTHLSVCECCSA